MKKIVYFFLIIICVFCFKTNVKAEVYQENELIAVNTVATVETDKFLYQDFIFNTTLDEKGNGALNFNTITNKTNSKDYVSINLLMFDEQQKNIGLLAYCSKLDYDSNYANTQIRANETTTFSIKVTNKYFSEGKGVNDVKYVAVMDDNKYCKIGGFTNYEGLTLKQISNGDVAVKENNSDVDNLLFSFRGNVLGKVLIVIVIFILIIVLFCAITGIILNALYKRMFAKATGLAYLPYYSNYLAVKLSFGELPSKIFLGCLLFGLLLSFMQIKFLIIITNVVSFIAFVVVIIKLITKKYDLFYYDPNNTFSNSVNNNTTNTNISSSSNNTNFIDNSSLIEENENKNENIIISSNNDIVDLNYDKVDTENKDIFSNINNISTGMMMPGNTNINPLNNNMNNSMTNQLNSTNENDKNAENSEEESDLSRFFR